MTKTVFKTAKHSNQFLYITRKNRSYILPFEMLQLVGSFWRLQSESKKEKKKPITTKQLSHVQKGIPDKVYPKNNSVHKHLVTNKCS